MIRSYITIALRLLVKNKVFSLINILGLSTGIACCILIALYLQDEFSYEKGFPNHEQIFRLNTTFISGGVEEKAAYVSPPIGPGLAREFPEIELHTRIMRDPNVEQHIVRYEDKMFFESSVYLADSTFFQVFPYELKEGNINEALNKPSTVVISEEFARKVFGDRSALDETLIINSGSSSDTFSVTGVVKRNDYPSHVDANIYMCLQSNGFGEWALEQTTWANNNMMNAYFKLREPSRYKELEPKFARLMDLHAGEELRASGRQKIITLQPLDDIRLHSNFRRAGATASNDGSITYIYIIATIGIFILLLACINFMNLTTARSAQRASEVGIRKSMGAFRTNLIRQFMGESMVIVLFSLLLSFLLVVVLLPFFNDIMQKQLSLNTQNLPFIAGAAIAIALITGLLAGSYPALFLSSLKPTQVLKGKSPSGSGSQILRKGLVVVQFVITITLISSIIIIRDQMSFIQSKSLGFDTEQVVMVPMRTATASQQYVSLKDAFSQIGGVQAVSATTSLPSTPLARDWGVFKEGSSNDQSVTHDIVSVDEGYFQAMGIDLLSGRDFNIDQDNLAGDTVSTTKIIVNEASLRAFNIPVEDAVGSAIYFQPESERYEFRIIGVVKDFHQFSLHRQITPMMFILPRSRAYFPYIAVSMKVQDYERISAEMKSLWTEKIADTPFETVFLEENLKNLYAAERRSSTLLTISTSIALLISCLGLYGLSVFVAERRTKEIGIRKVIGASVESIIGMLSKEYVKLIVISFVISVPLGYYAMDKWLSGFAYKIEPGVTVFIVSGLIAFTIAWCTISFESLRAARRNPVDTLRTN